MTLSMRQATDRVLRAYPANPDRPLGYGEFWTPYQDRDPMEWSLLWRRLVARDGVGCWYCKHRMSAAEGRPGTIDHIIPRERGGSNHLTNLRAACMPCNERKGAVLPSPVGLHECEYPAANLIHGRCLRCGTLRSKQSRKVAAQVEARLSVGPHECLYDPPEDPDALCVKCAVGRSKASRKRLNRRLRAD